MNPKRKDWNWIGLMVVLYFAITAGQFLTANAGISNGGGVSREQAIEIAKVELKKASSIPRRYEVMVDEDNKMWKAQMSLFRESSSKSDKERFRKYSSVLERRNFWTIYLIGTTPDGRHPKDDSFVVAVDRESGMVLFLFPDSGKQDRDGRGFR